MSQTRLSTEISVDESGPRPLLIQRPIKVRTYDIDSGAHVSNIVYLRWMEDLRNDLFEEHFPFAKLFADGYTPVIASTFIEYKRPVKLFDDPVGLMWIAEISSASIKFRGEVQVAGEARARAAHIGVFIDAKTERPVKLPRYVREKFLEAQKQS